MIPNSVDEVEQDNGTSSPTPPQTQEETDAEETSEPIRSRRKRKDSDADNDPNKREKVGDPFESGRTVFKDKNLQIEVQSIAHKRNHRFSLDDHLYNMKIEARNNESLLVFNVASALRVALTKVLDQLKSSYAKDLHHQVYVTVIERKILNGLNSGNYDINTPSRIISNRVLSMLYNYLKSYQTLRINPSFKIQLKVLSVKHMDHLRRSERLRKKNNYVPHVFNTRELNK